jgi:Fe-S-cluster containining protein
MMMTEYDDCKDCGGWCCAVPNWIGFNYQDRLRVAKEFGISVGQVTQEFSVVDKKEGKRIMKFTNPCIFWITGRCGIHKVKPGGCSEFVPLENCQKRSLHMVKIGRLEGFVYNV